MLDDLLNNVTEEEIKAKKEAKSDQKSTNNFVGLELEALFTIPIPQILVEVLKDEEPPLTDDYDLEFKAKNCCISRLLLNSNLKIKEILMYLEKEKTPFTIEIPPNSNTQYFHDNGKYYQLSENDMLIIHEKISALNNANTIKKTLERRPELLKAFEKTLNDTERLFNNYDKKTLLSKLNSFNINKIFCFVASNLLLDHLLHKNESENNFENKEINEGIAYVPLAIKLGELIFEYIINSLFNTIAEKNLKDLFDDYYDKKITSKELLEKHLKFDFTDLTESANLNKQLDGLRNSVMLHIFKHYPDFIQEQNVNLNIIKERQLINDLNKQSFLSLGAEVIDELIKFNFISIKNVTSYTSNKHKKDISKVFFNEVITSYITASATYFKPTLMLNQIPKANNYFATDKLQLVNKLNNNQIKNSYYSYVYPKKELEIIVNYAGEMPMQIETLLFDDFILLLKEQFNKPFDITNDNMLDLLELLYNIDFKTILKNNTNDYVLELLKEILTFAWEIDEDYPIVGLQARAEEFLTTTYCYNAIKSYKYQLKAFLADANIYKNFRYFYLPKYLTSTGRLYTRSHNISLQSFKFSRAFISFANQTETITEDNFSKLQEILNLNLNLNLNYTFVEWKTQQKKLTTAFIQSKVKQTFPQEIFEILNTKKLTLFENLILIKPFIKKQTDLLYICNIIRYIAADKTIDHLPYEEDATTSGLQMIAAMLNSSSLSKASNMQNVLGIDFYSTYAGIFCTTVEDIQHKLHSFFKSFFDCDVQDFFSKTIIIKDNSELKDIQEYLLKTYFPNEFEEDLIPQLKKLQSLPKIKVFAEKLGSNIHLKQAQQAWLIPKAQYKLKTHVDHILYQLWYYLQFYKLIYKIPKEFYNNRKFFKRGIMTVPYNAGKTAFEEQMLIYFKKQYALIGALVFEEKEIKELIPYIYRFFKTTLRNDSNFKDCFEYLALLKNVLNDHFKTHKEKTQPLRFPYKYLIFDYVIYKNDSTRLIYNSKSVPLTLRPRVNIMKEIYFEEQMEIKLASLIAQGCDAQIVHVSFLNLININNLLKVNNIPLIYLISNHDCFGSNILYANILKELIRNAYNDLFACRYGEIFLKQKKVENILRCTGNNFLTF